MPTPSHSENLIALAESIARDAHDGQTRRGGNRPYIVHPEAVASRVESTDEKAVAWLHDVIEDTELELQDLIDKGIPLNVVGAVELLTKADDADYQDYLEKLSSNALARTVKVADLLSNLADAPSEKQIVKYAKALLFLHER